MTLLLVPLLFGVSYAGHCYRMQTCADCIKPYGATDCGWCTTTNSCGMHYDSCDGEQFVTGKMDPAKCPAPVVTELPGEPFFKSITDQLEFNPKQRNYGVSITDIDNDGTFEIVVAGFGYRNLAYKWNSEKGLYDEIADEVLQDSKRKAIGLAACDIDGDGFEELYVLNTDQYSGDTTTSDGLFDNESGKFFDLFTEERNLKSGNFVAGRSCACVDRFGTGKYSVVVANYGGNLKVFEINESNVLFDAAPDAGMDLRLGGRALVAGPILTDRTDVFANNEVDYSSGRRTNFMFKHKGGDEGEYENVATAVGLGDATQTGRGTALLDSNGDGLVDIVYGNWQGPHRLYEQSKDGTFSDAATADMAVASNIRTVIVADFDNDGYEEIFWNNIPGENRLFRKLPEDEDWLRINIGDALEMDGMGTGGAVGDFDGDGMLELIVSHGESGPLQPLSLYRANWGESNNYLRILPKTINGAPARGARVDLKAGGRNQMRIIDAGSGYLCQMEPVAHFGLGKITEVENVRVQWPDASVCEFVPRGINGVISVLYSAPGVCELVDEDVTPTEDSADECITANPETSVMVGESSWDGKTTDDFFDEYFNIFTSRNRNAASHKWAAFILERSMKFSEDEFVEYFGSFCPVSGSIVYKSDMKRYGMAISHVNGGNVRFGFMYFCCWPCICDTQDFIRYDTKTVRMSDGSEKEFTFVVEPNPCEDEAKLNAEWIEPFRGQRTTLFKSAPELKCVEDAKHPGKKMLEGAILSDNGYPIIGMLHDSMPMEDSLKCTDSNSNQPGRMTAAPNGNGKYQSACEMKRNCERRAQQGYNSGMGMIFRKVAEIGQYKKVCPANGDNDSASDSEKKDDKPSGNDSAGACEGKNRGECKKASDTCSWAGAEKKCYAAGSAPSAGAKVMPGMEDGTFSSFKKICSNKEMCKACGGKLKKKNNKCALKPKKIRCNKFKDETLCSSVPGCSLGKKGCKGKPKFN